MTTPAPIDARPLVEALLADATARGASDIHVDPAADSAAVRLRIDGLLEPHSAHSADAGRAIVARLMVMAGLLTYRLDIPQEGRIAWTDPTGRRLELRLAIMPTTHGLRAAVRLPAELLQPHALAALQLPAPVLAGLQVFARADTGLLLLTGPAGSGKTTTIYALLEYIRDAAGQSLSIISLEDPVERNLPGIVQIEVAPHGQLTYERALRSILRQDPQVLMLGEIRDAATASLAIQAALSGHRLISTLHAGDPASALARLLEMGLEPYQITSALFAVIAQRLLRKLAPNAGVPPEPPAEACGPDEPRSSRRNEDRQADRNQEPGIKNREPSSCSSSLGALRGSAGEGGPYSGRVPAAEIAVLDPLLRGAVLRRADAAELRTLFSQRPGHVTMRASAQDLVARHLTDSAELTRVLGDAGS